MTPPSTASGALRIPLRSACASSPRPWSGPKATRFVSSHGVPAATFIPLRDVASLEADGNYLRVRTAGTEQLVRQTMKEIEQRLDPASFVRIHRSAIVAIDRITAIEAREHGEYVVRLDDGRRLESSRTYSVRLRKLLKGR